MNDRIKVRFARESDADAMAAFARDRVAQFRQRGITVDWAGAIPFQAQKIASDTPGKHWRVFVAVSGATVAGRVITWIEPPTDPASGNHEPRVGTLGLTGLITAPDVPNAARALADWSASYAGALGLSEVRLPTTVARLSEYYPTLGFTLRNKTTAAKGKSLWEFTRPAEDWSNQPD